MAASRGCHHDNNSSAEELPPLPHLTLVRPRCLSQQAAAPTLRAVRGGAFSATILGGLGVVCLQRAAAPHTHLPGDPLEPNRADPRIAQCRLVGLFVAVCGLPAAVPPSRVCPLTPRVCPLTPRVCPLTPPPHGCSELTAFDEGAFAQGGQATRADLQPLAEANRIVALWPHVSGPPPQRDEGAGDRLLGRVHVYVRTSRGTGGGLRHQVRHPDMIRPMPGASWHATKDPRCLRPMNQLW
jgi:hypothetical protein